MCTLHAFDKKQTFEGLWLAGLEHGNMSAVSAAPLDV